ncbi:NAD-dependent epimerase/dehydratase family protein [Candidatus Woesearchaeota archaeon]|nr:NAD-dependent epimerase/dehydratase family protein [Candidatus Woesearchaeota archaeon]
MRAIITGSEGFVGPFLIKELLENGYDIVGTYHSEVTRAVAPAKYIKLNILDKDKVRTIFDAVNPDVVFHLAAVSDVGFSRKNPELTKKVNILGTENVLSSAKKAKKLIISSAHVYGIPEKIPIKEDDPVSPNSPYAESKLKAEKIGKNYNAFIARSFNHIGPGQTDKFVASAFAKQIAELEKNNENTIKVGNLEAKRDFTDVRDVVKAYRLIIEKASSKEIYNVCSGKAYSIQKMLDLLLEMSNKKIIVEQDPERMRKSDIPILKGDYTKLKKATGWEPEISFRQSLKDILEFWRANIK